MFFKDRYDAGRLLADTLLGYRGQKNVLVLGLPRGGVPVAYEVAAALGVPLDVFVVRKLGFPGQEELAIGAIASGGVRVVNEDITSRMPEAEQLIEMVVKKELPELERREKLYHTKHAACPVSHKNIILIDDGVATGATMRAAVQALRKSDAAKIIVAVPVGAADTCQTLRHLADEVICLHEPDYFGAVGNFYTEFSQTTDEEVQELLQSHTL